MAIKPFLPSKLREYAGDIHSALLVNGEDLTALGYRPGPLFRKILKQAEDVRLEGVARTRGKRHRHIKCAFPMDHSDSPTVSLQTKSLKYSVLPIFNL